MNSASASAGRSDLRTLLEGQAGKLLLWTQPGQLCTATLNVAVILLGAGLYGATMGWWRDPLEGLYVAFKFPLILLLMVSGNAPLKAMLAPLLGLKRGLWFRSLDVLQNNRAIIRENMTINIMRNRIIVRPALVTGLILLIPLFGNLFIEGWNWPLGAFILAGVMLFATGLTYELVARKMNNKAYRFAVGLAVGTAFVVSWVNLVRVSESENAANLMYYGVPVIGAIGAVIARFQPHGMALALFATALAQVLVPMILMFFWGIRSGPGVAIGFGGSAFFATLFVASASLFRRASANRL